MNFFLADVRTPAALSHILDASRGRGEPENFRIDQIVVQDDVSFAQNPASFHGQQFRIAGTRANQVDFAFPRIAQGTLRRSRELASAVAARRAK